MHHFCLVHITNSSILNGLQTALKYNRLSSAAFLRNAFLPTYKVLWLRKLNSWLLWQDKLPGAISSYETKITAPCKKMLFLLRYA